MENGDRYRKLCHDSTSHRLWRGDSERTNCAQLSSSAIIVLGGVEGLDVEIHKVGVTVSRGRNPAPSPFFPHGQANQDQKYPFLISSLLSGARAGELATLARDCLDEHVLAGYRKPTEAGYPFASDQTMDLTPHFRKGKGESLYFGET